MFNNTIFKNVNFDLAIKKFSSLINNKRLSNTGIYTVGNVLGQAISFFSLPILTRFLTPEDFGIFNYTSSIQSILLIISTLYLNAFAVRNYFDLETEKDRKDLFGTIFIAIVVNSLFVLCVASLIFPVIIKIVGIKIPFYPYFEVAFIINFFDILSYIPLIYYRNKGQAWKYFALTFSKAVLTFFVVILFVVKFKMGLMGRYYGVLLPSILYAFIYLYIISRISSFSFKWRVLIKALRFCLPLFPADMANVALLSTDRIVLERYVSISSLGIYSISLILGTSLMFLIRGFYQAIEPDIYKSFNEEGFDNKIIRIKNTFLYLLLALGCLMIVFNREFVSIMVSKKFAGCYLIIPILVAATLFRGIEMLLNATLYAFKKTSLLPILSGGAFIVNLLANLVLIPRLGIWGAAISSLASSWFLYVASIIAVQKFSEIKWTCFKDTFIVMGCCGISYLVMLIHCNNIILTVLTKTAIVFVVSWVFFLKSGISKQLCVSQPKAQDVLKY